MAGRSIVEDESSLARCRSPQKLQTSKLSIGLEETVDGLVECRKDKYQNSFNQLVSVFLRGICPGDCLRPLPPMLGTGKSVDLLKLFIAVKRKGGYDTVTEMGLWDKVGEDNGLGSGIGSAIRLIYMKYLDSLERELMKFSEGKGFKDELWYKSDNLDGVLMELEAEFECFVSKVSDERKIVDECDNLKVKSELSFTGASEVKNKNQNVKVEKSEASSTDGASSVMLDNQKGFIDADAVDDVKSSVNSDAFGKCLVEDDEELMIMDSDAVKQEAFKHKRKRDCLSRMLHWLANVGKDPTDPAIVTLPEISKWKSYGSDMHWKQVLSAREALFLRRPEAWSAEYSFWQKKQKMHPSMFEDQIGSAERLRSSPRLFFAMKSRASPRSSFFGTQIDVAGAGLLFTEKMEDCHHQQPLRKDGVSLENSIINSHAKKRVPVSSCFQVDVPEWTGEAAESNSKWLGTRVWPLEKKEPNFLIERDPIGKGRLETCGCQLPGSVECVRFHIAEKRKKLKLEIGSAFYHWNFDKMGEEVQLSWTEDEEKKFKAVVKANPQSQNKCFWGQMFRSLPMKNREDQVSYYYNVFLLQRRGHQNRYTSNNIDSDDDETEFGLATNGQRMKPAGSILTPPRKTRICS